MLAHGGAIFFLLAAAFYFSVTRATGRITYMVFSIATFLSIYTPWVFYQRVIQPPGDRLLKWHLAGVIPVTEESFKTVYLKAHNNMTMQGLWKRVLSQLNQHFISPLKGLDGIPFTESFYWSIYVLPHTFQYH